MKTSIVLILAAILLFGCIGAGKASDKTGTTTGEKTEIKVSEEDLSLDEPPLPPEEELAEPTAPENG